MGWMHFLRSSWSCEKPRQRVVMVTFSAREAVGLRRAALPQLLLAGEAAIGSGIRFAVTHRVTLVAAMTAHIQLTGVTSAASITSALN